MSTKSNLTRSMSQASRSANRNRREPVPFKDTPPLTPAEYHAHRMAEEQASRDEIKRLRDSYSAHEQSVKAAEMERRAREG